MSALWRVDIDVPVRRFAELDPVRQPTTGCRPMPPREGPFHGQTTVKRSRALIDIVPIKALNWENGWS
jgi:hypothetical protein